MISKTEKTILEAINKDGFYCAESGFKPGRKNSSYGARVGFSLKKLQKEKK